MTTDSVAKPKKFWPASDTGLMVKVVEAKEPAIRTRSIFKAALWAGGVGSPPEHLQYTQVVCHWQGVSNACLVSLSGSA